MAETTKQNISFMFYYVCLILALALAGWCVSEYAKNEDVTEISFQPFDSHKYGSQYPSMTICTLDPYKELELSTYNDSNINSKLYSKFLVGGYWNKDMISID